MKLKSLLPCLISTLCLSLPTLANEGMWLLPLLQEQNIREMKGLGLDLCAEDIYHPDSVSLKDAVVIFGRGCTGEVISAEGLILTNHHCGYDAIQKHSSLEKDLLTDGFWAMNREEELPNPGLTVTFIDKIENVTDFVVSELAKDSANFDYNYLDADYLNLLAEQKVGKDFLNAHPGTEVLIKPFFGGNQYYMFTQKVYSDIRMVGAPPSSIGKFGADTDNWMWPRHTGDFSLFRVYTDKDGNPASYSKENIPLRPKKYFNISLKGIQENDFMMLMGFPGRTNHFYTAAEVKDRAETENSIRVMVRDLRQQLMLQAMLADPSVRIQYAGKYASSTNSYKSSKGMNKMIGQQKLTDLKQAEQNELIAWATQNNHPEYIQAVTTIDSIITDRQGLKRRQQYLSEALLTGIEFSKSGSNFDRLIKAINAENKDTLNAELLKFEKAYHKFNNKNYNQNVDRTIAKAMLKLYTSQIASDQRPDLFVTIDKKFKGDIDKYVDHLLSRSIFGNEQNLKRFIKNPSKKQILDDPMFSFARSVTAELISINAQLLEKEQKLAKAHHTYIKGLLELNAGKPLYPDANFTLRLTYGRIAPMLPADGIKYNYYTTMEGIMEKEDSTNWEFIVSPRLKELYQQKDFGDYRRPDGKMPVCFIADTHTTGGNSGSPVINAQGELVGTGFDRNWEGISGDIQYNNLYQRTICVDIRYTLFIIEKLAGAKHLIDEMTIVRE